MDWGSKEAIGLYAAMQSISFEFNFASKPLSPLGLMAICHYARYARYAYSCIDSQGREAFTDGKIRRRAVLVNTGTHERFRSRTRDSSPPEWQERLPNSPWWAGIMRGCRPINPEPTTNRPGLSNG